MSEKLLPLMIVPLVLRCRRCRCQRGLCCVIVVHAVHVVIAFFFGKVVGDFLPKRSFGLERLFVDFDAHGSACFRGEAQEAASRFVVLRSPYDPVALGPGGGT